MLNTPILAAPQAQEGSALLEGLIAVLIFSLGILALVGLQANSMRVVTDSKMRIDASNIAGQRIGAMWAKQGEIDSFGEEDTDIPELPNGKRSTTITGNAKDGYVVTVTVTWSVPGSDEDQEYTTVSQLISNPPSSAP